MRGTSLGLVALPLLLASVFGSGCRQKHESVASSASARDGELLTEPARAPAAAPTAAAASAAMEPDDLAAPSAPAPKRAAREEAYAAAPEARGRAEAKAGPGGWGGGALAPQASVKAGEWDDNANYREFTRFLAGSPTAHHRVALDGRRFLVVRDVKGRGVPRCKVTVADAENKSTSFITNASGRAILFPRAEGLTSDKLYATARCEEGSTETSFATFERPDGVVDLRLATERRPIGVRAVDVAFVLDTTGSMSEEIVAVKATIQAALRALSNEQTSVRVGLVEYKDRTDPFVTKVYPFSRDLAAFSRGIEDIRANGGGDTPEDMNAGLHAALTELSWDSEAVSRLAFVIADAPPHLDYQGPDYVTDMKTASRRGIQLFTVAASGMDPLGQVVMRQLAQYTGGTNMFVLRGGAGPQSTGGGDPASSCGGTQTNYASGKLDELIVGKIRRELRALDGDPMRIAGLDKDENAKPCDQRVVFASQ